MRVWKRLTESYGERFTQQYGPMPNESWCEVIDHASDNAISLALASFKASHLQHPPTLPEFESAVTKARGPSTSADQPDVREELIKYIKRSMNLKGRQLMGPWSWIVRWHPGKNQRGEHVEKWAPEYLGVIIPAESEHDGLRVMVADMVAADAFRNKPALRVVQPGASHP